MVDDDGDCLLFSVDGGSGGSGDAIFLAIRGVQFRVRQKLGTTAMNVVS